MSDDFGEKILKAHERSFQRAFETAVRTGTALIYARDGKIVEVKPPYRYELVPIKPAGKKKAKPPRRKKLRYKTQQCLFLVGMCKRCDRIERSRIELIIHEKIL